MATTYNPVLVGDIDITETYRKLMLASIGQDSVYLKAKETINDSLSAMVGLSDIDKAKILADMVGGIAKEITNSAMQMALKIDMENRDDAYNLTKLREDTKLVTAQIAKIEKDTEDADWSVKNRVMAGWKAQAELYRDYGVQPWNQTVTTDIIPQAAYIDYGIKTETIKKAKADIYQGYAQGFRANGYVSVVLNADGSIGTSTAGSTVIDTAGLTYQQTKVAVRQEKAFEDNKKQHVVNSSASFMSTLLATETEGIAGELEASLAKWNTAIDYLNLPTP